jgi:hypothetical protein
MNTRECKRCGRMVAVVKSGHLKAHQCHHGQWCTPPYIARRRGVKRGQCLECFRGRQLALRLDE